MLHDFVFFENYVKPLIYRCITRVISVMITIYWSHRSSTLIFQPRNLCV